MPPLIESLRHQRDRAAFEANKLLRIRNEQTALGQLGREVRQLTESLGGEALATFKAGELDHPRLVAICQQIGELEEQIRQHEARLESIRAEQAPPAEPARAFAASACPQCQAAVPDGTRFCPNCGARQPEPAPAVTCSRCGATVPGVAVFCPGCGQRIVRDVRHCSGCGAALSPEVAFCPDCGTPAEKSAAPAVTAPAPVAEPLTPPADAPGPAPAAGAAVEVEDPPAMVAQAVPQTRVCDACHATLPAEATFCPECGNRLA